MRFGDDDEPSLFDQPEEQPKISAAGAAAARDDAMDRVEKHAAPDWKESAKQAVYRVCVDRPDFLVDDVWPEFERVDGEFAYTGTHDKRAMGPIVVSCSKEGWCESSNTRLPSAIVGNHKNWRTLWKSKLYRKETP